MKKRLVLTLMLIGLLAFGAGLGTYAWFTSEAKSEGNVFSVGTLQLNGKIEGENQNLFDTSNMQPGDSAIKMKSFVIKNTGTLDMKIRIYGRADFSDSTYNVDGDYFKIHPEVKINGEIYTNRLENCKSYDDGLITATDFVSWLENEFSDYELNPNKNIRISGWVKLDKEAGNTYQGSNLNLSLVVYAKQDKSGATFPHKSEWLNTLR